MGSQSIKVHTPRILHLHLHCDPHRLGTRTGLGLCIAIAELAAMGARKLVPLDVAPVLARREFCERAQSLGRFAGPGPVAAVAGTYVCVCDGLRRVPLTVAELQSCGVGLESPTER